MGVLLLPLALLSTHGLKAQDSTITVFAAASLKDAFTSIGQDYEKAHPGVHVALDFAGSQTLAAQISQGAPADVFAAASLKTLQAAPIDPGSIRFFAHNRLTIVLRKGLKGIRSAKDLAQATKIVLADESVPAGSYAQKFIAAGARVYGQSWSSSVQSHVVSKEPDVRSVLAKVAVGEADAGIVYVSDAASARGKVVSVPIPEPLNPLAKYPVAMTATPANKAGAHDFIKFLFSPTAQSDLEQQGFISPLHPVASLIVEVAGKVRKIKLPLASSFRRISITAPGAEGKTRNATGVPIDEMLPANVKSVTFKGADEYTKTIPRAQLAGARAVLVRNPDGNYQVVIAGLKPSWWVNWIRRISAQ